MKIPLVAAALLLIGAQARAAVLYELDPEMRAKTMEVLAERNINYREKAESRLKGKGHFDRQRLEIAGMLAADDTRRFAPADFDDYIKPSVKADKGRTIGERLGSLLPGKDYDLDKKEMMRAMRGEMTERAKKTVAAYKDMEINEIVAHSWGSQLIYAAILNGEMRPPKKLIVVGVPDNDRAKWSLLAARTGTEVFWGRADNDAAALDKGVKFAVEAAKDVDFEAKWDAACAADKVEERICLPHGRRPRQVVVIPIGNLPNRFPLPLGHDRADYYEALRKKGYFKVTAQQLASADDKNVIKEMAKVEQDEMTSAHEEARRLVETARAQSIIAQRDHDARLKRTYADIAIRSCVNPGSVTQSELDNLPVPYQENLLMASESPHGLDECSIKVYRSLRRGVDAAVIRERSKPLVPIIVRPAPPTPRAARPTVDFNSMFPTLKDIASIACASPSQATLGTSVLQSAFPYSFSRNWDDEVAARFAANLGECPRKLFYELIETIRSGKASAIDDQWLRDAARRFSTPVYVAPPPRSSLPTGCIPGDNSRRNCIACGNKYCS